MHMHVKRAYVLKKGMVLKQSDFFLCKSPFNSLYHQRSFFDNYYSRDSNLFQSEKPKTLLQKDVIVSVKRSLVFINILSN